MLYQTHQPFFFQFHPFTSIPLSATTKSLLSSYSSSIQEMECSEAALKSSCKEMAMKLSPQTCVVDDMYGVNGQNGGVSCDDFFVDDLLDFSNDDGFVEGEEEEEDNNNNNNKGRVSLLSVSPEKEQEQEQNQQEEDHNSNQSTNFESIPTSELVVPAEDLAHLEWLSHFVEDSNSEYSTAYLTGTLPEEPKICTLNRPKTELETPVSTKPCFKTPVPAKARSKRTRTGGRVWSLGSPSFTESSSSSTSSSSSSSPSSPWLIYVNPGSSLEPVEPVCWEKPLAKKPKRKPASEAAATGGGGFVAQPPRRCSHCGVQKTPQWRTGPLGAKTLCNACGVRYKSGRLLPEYRPACSPTFSSELHSNHHRKVLEMRRKKEPTLGEAEPGLAPPVVPSF